MIKALISSISFASGLRIDLASNSLLVIIGPNNAGKSATLADIRALVSGNPKTTVLLSELGFVRQSSLEEIRAELGAARSEDGQYQLANYSFQDGNLQSWWSDQSRGIGDALTKLLISDLNTRSRLADCDPPNTFNARNPHLADHPFQRMYANDALELKISKAVRR